MQKIMLAPIFHMSIFLILIFLTGGCAVIPPAPEAETRPFGLIRTYSEKPIPAGIAIHNDETYETLEENETRTAFLNAAKNTGYVIDEAQGLSLSIQVEASDGSVASFGKSRLQFRDIGVDRPNRTRNFEDESITAIALSSPVSSRPAIPGTLKMRIAISDQQDNLWTGIAHAPLDGRSRKALIHAMAEKLASLIGQNAHTPQIRFQIRNSDEILKVAEPLNE